MDGGARDGTTGGDDATTGDDGGGGGVDSGGGEVDSGRTREDGGRTRDGSADGLPEGAVCGPGGREECAEGLSCCYPCGVSDCLWVCTPTCAPDTPGCIDGCPMRI